MGEFHPPSDKESLRHALAAVNRQRQQADDAGSVLTELVLPFAGLFSGAIVGGLVSPGVANSSKFLTMFLASLSLSFGVALFIVLAALYFALEDRPHPIVLWPLAAACLPGSSYVATWLGAGEYITLPELVYDPRVAIRDQLAAAEESFGLED